MPEYGVIVCPKCRMQAQIVELGAAKSTRCQRCGAKLANRKLRLFFSSEELTEAVSARTQIQAKLHDGNVDLESILNGTGFKNALGNREENGISISDLVDRRETRRRKRDPRQMILELLRSNGGCMEIDSLMEAVAGYGMEEEKFEKTLEKLLHSGDVYMPSNEKVQLV